jgi:hypothetical protein
MTITHLAGCSAYGARRYSLRRAIFNITRSVYV